ncbi:hypothetical protein [Alkalihalobacillus sp. 1P02AB]|uniref:hypothetical protein n=1 Tax=Alkalihalobacillus sp. 1P02AB TaxID=3132260 RepID=UPI0039A6E471
MAHEGKKLIPGLGTLVKIQPDEVSFQIEHQADSAATTLPELVADFNELLAKLQASGIMKKQ